MTSGPGSGRSRRDEAVIARAFRRSLLVLALGAGLVLLLLLLRREPAGTEEALVDSPLPQSAGREPVAPAVPFSDVTREAGITFVHTSGAEGEKLLPETTGGGCAFLDYDGDGDQDLLFVDGRRWPWSADGPPAPGRSSLVLYRNDGHGRFEEVPGRAGLDAEVYGMGAAVGDYDGDGWVDLYVTAVGRNRLFRNVGGRFSDVTADAGVGGDAAAWSTAAAFVDTDRDGDLDLFVGNYVRWSREIDLAQGFQLTGIGRAYGPPRSFEGSQPYLFRNEGGGRFTEVAEPAGLHVRNPATGVPVGKALGVAPHDVDRDGWIDLLVANDTVPNFLFHNRGDGTFEEIGVEAGVAFDTYGNARSAMGIDAAYFANDDRLAYAIGNFANEMTALYVSQGSPRQYADEAIATGIGPPSRLALTFATIFFDYDLDGRQDLLAVNGHLEEEINKVQPSQHYAQPPQLFWNTRVDGRPRFVLASAASVGDALLEPMVGRGAAVADIDADGDLDVVMTQIGGPPRLLRNDQALGHHWLRFELEDAGANRHAVGAMVEVRLGDQVLRRTVSPTRGYLSQSELPVTIGLGTRAAADQVRVVWPDGQAQVIPDVQVDAVSRVRR